jgi:hypothetical protein
MRKGSYAPRVRARWTKTQFDRTSMQWPVWVQPNFFGVYTYFIGPFPVPVSLVDTDFDPACWSYCPAAGKIRYEGNWNAIAVGGRWALEIKTDYDLIIKCRMGIKWLDVAFGTGAAMGAWTDYVKSDFVGPATLAMDTNCAFFNISGGNIMALDCNGSYGLRYAEIEALPADREDTRPVSWTAPDDPW